MKLCSLSLIGLFSTITTFSYAATSSAPAVNAAPVNLFQTIISLVLIVGILIGLAVLFKKFGLNRINPTVPIKIIGAVHIGNNQRIMVIEAGEEWLVLGATPHHISTLTTMPRQENEDLSSVNQTNHPTWLQNALQKYQRKN
jgi:flagellar protein FliO/FliZ